LIYEEKKPEVENIVRLSFLFNATPLCELLSAALKILSPEETVSFCHPKFACFSLSGGKHNSFPAPPLTN
jgi:hypothetical protein